MTPRLRPFLAATAAGLWLVAPVGARAVDARYGLDVEAVPAEDGSVDVTIRNTSKVPVSMSKLAVVGPDASRCAGPADAIPIAPGAVVHHRITGCGIAQARLRANAPLAAMAPRPAASGATLRVGAEFDRMGVRHGLEAGFEASRP